MRIEQMRRRERFDEVLVATLGRGLSDWLGHPVEVTPGSGAGQLWYLQPFFSAYCTARAGAAVRRFLRDSMRFTPRRRRLPAQMAAAELLSLGPALRAAGRPAFTVAPSIPADDTLLILPGNQRVRIFDFARATSRVFLKTGFDDRPLAREIAVRGGPAPGPFPPLTAFDTTAGWFEEPILDGVVLPRLPPWRDAPAAARRTLLALTAWARPTRRAANAAPYVQGLVARATAGLAIASDRGWALPPDLPAALAALADCAAGLGRITVAATHGDLQPGNVLVLSRGHDVSILDWEHSRERSFAYDLLTFALEGRTGPGLVDRLAVWVRTGALDAAPYDLGPLAHELLGAPERDVRRALSALHLLEDFTWFVDQSTSNPFVAVPEGLAGRSQDLAALTTRHRGLFGAGV